MDYHWLHCIDDAAKSVCTMMHSALEAKAAVDVVVLTVVVAVAVAVVVTTVVVESDVKLMADSV